MTQQTISTAQYRELAGSKNPSRTATKLRLAGHKPGPAHTLPPEHPWSTSFDVEGDPVTQGSMEREPRTIKGKRVMVTVHAHEGELWRWRNAVAAEAEKHAPPLPLNGAVEVECRFRLPLPGSAPKRRRIPANTKPDLDKCARAVLDSLVDAGVLAEDSRVTDLILRKRYAYDGPLGVTITVREVDGLS